MALVVSSALTGLLSCAEKAGTGERVAIPRVYVDCRTGRCNATSTPRYVVVSLTTSGCELPQYGEEVATLMEMRFNCVAGAGCSGEATGWVDKAGSPTATIPSGTYSICAYIDYDGSWPTLNQESFSSKESISIGTTTSDQYLTTWRDL